VSSTASSASALQSPDGAAEARRPTGALLRRFLVPAPLVTAICWLRFRAFVSPRAEVELSPLLRLGAKTQIGSFTKIKATDGAVEIGARVDIATGCFVAAHTGGIQIGDDALIGPNVSLVGNTYRFDRLDVTLREQGKTSKGPIRIGRNVLLGAGCVVLDGVEIGDGAIVAPNSVVTTSLPGNVVAAGNPARPVFTRR
jgi:acetyltransferase-like isoleucine patch superfamily enzyme